MCIQWHRRCCCHAKHPELIPSNIAAFCFFCVCLLLLFSLFHFLIMLFNYYYYFFFCTFVFSRFCALSKFEMLTKMVVNAKNKHTRTHTHFLHHAIAFDLAVISVRCQHILIVAMRIYTASLESIALLFFFFFFFFVSTDFPSER